MVNAVRKEIHDKGIAIRAVADIDECELCKVDNIHTHDDRVYKRLSDGYVYSIGFHEKGFPEIFVFVGPCDEAGEHVLTKQQMLDRIQDAGSFIEHIYLNKDTFKFDKRQANKSNISDKHYWVICFDESEDLGTEVKCEMLQQTVEYYGHANFKTVVFKPHIRN